MKDHEEPLELQPPLDYGSPYIDIHQAAFIMQEPEEVLIDWIHKGLLLALDTGAKNDRKYRIHQSELDRFRHPWKHIWRLDERITGLQKSLDLFKQKINMGQTGQQRLNAFADRLDDAEYKFACRKGSEDIRYDGLNNAILKIEERLESMAESRATIKRNTKRVARPAKKRK